MSLTFTAAVRANKPKRNVGKISIGYGHGVAIQKNGRAWGWGYNFYGQIGDNTTVPKTTPVNVIGTLKTFCQISAGNVHSFAIDKNGRIWSWGANSQGQLGDNTIVSKLTPISLGGTLKTFCKISGGGANASVAIDRYGMVWGWGDNNSGQLGNNLPTACVLTPVSVVGAIKTFCQISHSSSGRTHAIDKNGRLWGWGENFQGLVGNNTSFNCIFTPVLISGAVKTFCQISNRGTGGSVIDKNGQVWGWGFNNDGQLGNNDLAGTSYPSPVMIAGATKTFCKISSGYNNVLAIDKYGMIWGWGSNSYGELGNNYYERKYTPIRVGGLTKTFCEIFSIGFAFNFGTSVAIDKNGRAWGWGYNGDNQLGNNPVRSYKTPVSVVGTIKTFCQINAGHNVTNAPIDVDGRVHAIDKNGILWSWGSNNTSTGGLGDGTTYPARTPINVAGATATKTFCQISAGGYGISCAIDKNGRAWAWGFNTFGQTGDGTTNLRLTPVSVVGTIKTFCKISAGLEHCAALDNYGKAWSWGNNSFGQLGDNSITAKCTPVAVAGGTKTFCHIEAGSKFTAAIDKYGKIWTWGNNYTRQLGDGTATAKSTPVAIAGATKTFCKINSGGQGDARRLGGIGNTLAIDKYGMIWAWGSNLQGQLGNNSTVSTCTPVSVVGALKTFCQISAGTWVCCAIDKNGRAWCWGSNNIGQVGDNSMTDRYTPVSVAGAVKTFCHITVAAYQSYAIDKNGRAWSWGGIGNGALGNDTDVRVLTPIRICNI